MREKVSTSLPNHGEEWAENRLCQPLAGYNLAIQSGVREMTAAAMLTCLLPMYAAAEPLDLDPAEQRLGLI